MLYSKKITICLSLLLVACGTFAQSPREKVYLHTDKNSYISGDTIWFKSYLMNALTQKPSTRSGIEYVELIDKDKKCLKRLALHTTYGTSYGEIAVDTSYSTGKYVLRAYTNWMQNLGDSLFFQKAITISRLKDGCFITASGPQIQQGNDSTNIRQTFSLSDETGAPLVLAPVNFFVKDTQGKILQHRTLYTNGSGELTTDYALSRQQITHGISVEIGRSKDDIIYKQNLFKGKDIDLQFLPESGHLIAGQSNEIGFKAVGADGKGVDVSGIIKDNTGKEIARFKSLYKGMGVVSFTVQANKTYVAILDNGQQISLPQSENSGTIVHIECDNKDTNDISVGLTVKATPDLQGKNYVILGSSRGKEIYRGLLTIGDSSFSTYLPKNIFPTGVASFRLINDKNQIVNERPFFVDNKDELRIKLTTPQQTYHTHDSIPVTITVKDKDNHPVVGSFSLAVTDNNQVYKDFTKDQTLLSYILLQSDLCGTIETPNYYFFNQNDTTSQALDALMLTQGFVRYDWDTTKFRFQAEPVFEVKGRVTNGFNKGVKNAKLILMSTDKKFTIVKDTTTDSKGYFTFTGFPRFDSTAFVLQSSKKLFGRFGLGINMQKFTPASVKNLIAIDLYQKSGADTSLANMIRQRTRYVAAFQKLNGYLPDIVLSSTKLPGSHNLNGAGQADQIVSQSVIRQNEDTTLLDLLEQNVKGFYIDDRTINTTQENGLNHPMSNDRKTQIAALSNMPVQKSSPLAVLGNINSGYSNASDKVLGGQIGDGTIIDFIFDGTEVSSSCLGATDFGSPSLSLRMYLQHWLASDIKSIEVITSEKYLKLYRQRFNYNHITYPTSTKRGDNGRWKIVFIEITTYSGNGPYLKVTPGMEYYHPQPFFYGRTFYSPKYAISDKDSLPDLRPTIFWTPFVVTDDNSGQAQFYFYSADTPAKYTLWLEGIDLNGNVGAQQGKVEIK